MKPSPGNSACEPARDEPLDLAVDLGEEILRPFQADREGGTVGEAPQRDRAGLAGEGAGDMQAQAKLSGGKLQNHPR